MSVILQKAISSHQTGNINEAYQLYLQHLQQFPEDLQAYELLGTLLLNHGQFREAIKAFNIIYQYRPSDSKNLQQLVQCYSQIGETAQAQQYLNKLVDLVGLKKDTLKLQVLLYQTQMKTAEALTSLKAYLDKHRHDYDVWLMMGDLLSDAKDYYGAIAAFAKAVALKPKAIVARHNLALAYRLAGKPEVALQHYQKVLNAGNDSFQLMHNLGNAYADLGRLEEAVKYYEKALSKNLAYVDSHKNLNALYWELEAVDLC
ncbi:MAG: tetratricopeptide repeat protein [Aestuariibacter sp.]